MGNELFNKYTISKSPLLQTGYLSLWNVYPGYHKEKKFEVCLFILDKKNLKKKYPKKAERKEIISLMKKDYHVLSKISHENVLSIVESLMEDKLSLGFVTESFTQSLGVWCDKNSPSKLEIKKIIRQIANAISDLNKTHSLTHNSINMHSIFLNKYNQVKIGNFGLSQHEGEFIIDFSKENYSKNFFSFLAPEIILYRKCYFYSDSFSLGCVVFSMLKRYINDKNRNFMNNPKNYMEYQHEIQSFGKNLQKINFNKEDNEFLEDILVVGARPTLTDLLTKSEWINDPKLKALEYIENLENNTDEENKIKFLTKLPECLGLFENKIIERKILKSLLYYIEKEKKKEIINVLLPCIFAICDMPMIKVRFERTIYPKIKSLFCLSDLSQNCVLFLINKIDFLADKIPQEEFEKSYLDVFIRCLDDPKFQSHVIDCITGHLINKISKEKIEGEIFTKMNKILSETTSNSLRQKILNYFICVCDEKLSQKSIEDLMESVSKINVSESSYEILISLVNLFRLVEKRLSIEEVNKYVTPTLISILLNGDIDHNCFEEIQKLIAENVEKIKEKRKERLTENDNKVNSFTNQTETEEDKSVAPFERVNDENFFKSFFKIQNVNTEEQSNDNINNTMIEKDEENKLSLIFENGIQDDDFKELQTVQEEHKEGLSLMTSPEQTHQSQQNEMVKLNI